MADRIERTWDGKDFVFVNCADYDETDVARVETKQDYTVVQLDVSTSNFWGANPNRELVLNSEYLFIWVVPIDAYTLSEFADAVEAIFDGLADPADFTLFSRAHKQLNTM